MKNLGNVVDSMPLSQISEKDLNDLKKYRRLSCILNHTDLQHAYLHHRSDGTKVLEIEPTESQPP